MWNMVYSKICYVCKEEKPLSAFNRNKCRKDGLQTFCRDCGKARSRQYYQENKEKHKGVVNVRKRREIQRNRAFVLECLLSNPCRVCGEADPAALEFDHLRDKENTVKNLAHNGSCLPRIQAEIEKCQVLCANCHRKKTAEEQNWYVFTDL